MPISKVKKAAYIERVQVILASYTKFLVVVVDNVGSKAMQNTRMQMRGKAEMLMGKKTLLKKALDMFIEKNPGHPMGKLEDYLKGTTGFIFTNGDLGEIRDIVYANKVPAPARAGGLAPIDVNVPSGPTGCDPGQTSFFQVLQIPTKIVKGQIEITSQVELIKAGDKVGPSEAALLDKLNIMPFEYCLAIKSIYDNGSTYGVEVLDIDDSVLAGIFCSAVRDVAAVSLATGIPSAASMPHVLGNTFKDLVSIVVGLDNYSFTEAEPYKAYLADPSAFAAASGGGGGGGEAAAAVVEDKGPAEEEVDALEGGMDMFGGGGGDY